jgi:hypothetical protein
MLFSTTKCNWLAIFQMLKDVLDVDLQAKSIKLAQYLLHI